MTSDETRAAWPLVSLCIPTHDDAAVVGDALRSAIAQDYAPLEILVLDNCSADDTPAVIRRVAADDARVRYVRHPKNLGMAGNFSAGITMARGEYVQVLCADDSIEPSCTKVLAAALQENPDAVLAACGRILTDASLRPQRVRRARSRAQVVPGLALSRECFAHGNRIGEPSAVMFRRTAATGGFSAEYNQLVDLDMWFRLLAVGAGVLLPDPLCRVRLHEGQATQFNIRSGRLVNDKRRLFRQFAPALAPVLTIPDRILWDLRMASSIARCETAGSVPVEEISEVFFPGAFRRLLRPIAKIAARAGAHRWYDR